MFTIDLLRGQGIPIKSRPWGAAIAAGVFGGPVLVAMAMFGFYLSNRIIIKVTNQEIAGYEKLIRTLSDAVVQQKSLEAEKDNINNCLSEALSSLDRHTQWSPILATVVKNMPNTVVLTNLVMRQSSVNKKIPKKGNPKKMIDVSVPVSTLQLSISGRPQDDSDKAVKEFKDRLRHLLASKIEDIDISQKYDTLEGQDVVSYQIDCTFKPEL